MGGVTDRPVEPTAADRPVVVPPAGERPRPISAEIGPCGGCGREAELNPRQRALPQVLDRRSPDLSPDATQSGRGRLPRLARASAPREPSAGWSVSLRQSRGTCPSSRTAVTTASAKVKNGPRRVLRVLPGRSRPRDHPWDARAVSWWGLGEHDWNPDDVWRGQALRPRWGVSAIRGTLQSDEARRHDARARDPRLRLGAPVRRAALLHLRCLVCLESLRRIPYRDDQVCESCEREWRRAGRPWDEQYRQFVTERRAALLEPSLRNVLNERARNGREARRAVWGRLAKLTPKELAAVLAEAQRRLHPLDHLAALDIAVACSLVRGESEETPCSERASFADVVRFPHTDDGGGERDFAASLGFRIMNHHCRKERD